jgi:hypothetical protein
MSDDNKNDYVRPMDEAAKQMYRNDPGLALKVEGLGHLAGVAFLLICLVMGLLIKVLG